jgi:curved DNA-binding protein
MPASLDYYSILGVGKKASPDEIKAAYRKLARTLHPDVNKSKDAQSQFSRVQEAYEALSDPEKRAQYDRFGAVPGYAGGGGAHQGATHTWSNAAGGNPFGDSFNFEMDDISSIFADVFGAQSHAQRHSTRQRPRAARPDTSHEVTIPFDLALRGGKHSLRLSKDGVVQNIDVTIPRGVSDGARLRIKGKGGSGNDLILLIRIAKHPLYTRKGLDLMVTVPLTISEATLGSTISMPTPSGPVDLTIPAGTSSHNRLRLKGKGVEDAKGKRGDLYALVRVVSPDPSKLSDSQREALDEIGKAQENPRQDSHWNPEE